MKRGHEVSRTFLAYSVQMLNCFWFTIAAIVYVLFGARYEFFVALIPYVFSINYFMGNDLTGLNSFFSRSQIMILSLGMIFVAWANFADYSTSLFEFAPELIFPSIIFSLSLLNLLIY